MKFNKICNLEEKKKKKKERKKKEYGLYRVPTLQYGQNSRPFPYLFQCKFTIFPTNLTHLFVIYLCHTFSSNLIPIT